VSTGFGSAGAATALDAMGAAYRWIKPHVGDPGAAGTANAAVETTRKQATWAATAAGVLASSGALQWTGVAGSEDWTHFSAWSASSGGTFGFSGTVTAVAMTAGQTVDVAAGGVTASVTLAA
jgi:hypothetical protein